MLDIAHYSLSRIHSHVAELAEMKRLYQGKVSEISELKQKLEESQTSLNKVCSLLVALFLECHHLLSKWASLSYYIHLFFSLVSLKVPAATYDAAIQANYLSATEGVFAFTQMHKCL